MSDEIKMLYEIISKHCHKKETIFGFSVQNNIGIVILSTPKSKKVSKFQALWQGKNEIFSNG